MSRWNLAAQLAGYPFALALIWVWFGIAERNALDLALSVVLGVGIALLLAWLLARVFEVPLQRSAMLVGLLLLIAAGLWWSLGYSAQVREWIALRISNVRGKPFATARIAWLYPTATWGVACALFASMLPLLLFARPRVVRSRQYWLAWLGLVAGGFWLPSLLINWIPKVTSLTAQTASMIVRFSLAYLISLAMVLGFAYFVRRIAASQSEPSSTT